MVNFLKGTGGGGDRFTDVLRQQLAESAAQRFMQSKYPQEQQAPQFDYAGTLVPAAFQAAQSAIGLKQQDQQQEQMQAQQEQQAQLLAAQLGIPLDQAMQIASAPPQLQKQMIDAITGQQKEGRQFERDLSIVELKHQNKLKEKEYEAILKGSDNPQDKHLRSANKLFGNIVKKIADPKKVPYASGLSIPYLMDKDNPAEREISLDLRKMINEYAKGMGMSEGTASKLYEESMKLIKTDGDSRKAWIQQFGNDLNPYTYDDNRALIRDYEEQGVIGRMQDSSMQQPPEEMAEEQQQFDLSGLDQQQRNYVEEAKKKAAILTSGAGQALGLPGNIESLYRQGAAAPEVQTGVPLNVLANIDEYSPEIREQILQTGREQKALPQEERYKGDTRTLFPTSSDMKAHVAKMFPEGYTVPETWLDNVIEEVGFQAPFIALTGIGSGAKAVMKPLTRAIASGASVATVDKMGGGEKTKFAARIGTGILMGKLENLLETGNASLKMSKDLGKVTNNLYQEVEKAGENIKLDVSPVNKAFESIERPGWSTFSNLPEDARKGLKELADTYGNYGTGVNKIITMKDAIELRQAISKRLWSDIKDKSARTLGYKVIDAFDDAVKSGAPKEIADKYFMANNIYRGLNQANAIEKGIEWLGKSPKYAGIKSRTINALKYGIGTLGQVPAAGLRQAQYIWNYEPARKLAMKYIGETLTGRNESGKNAGIALMKTVQKLVNKEQD